MTQALPLHPGPFTRTIALAALGILIGGHLPAGPALAREPIPVSPGDPDRFSAVATGCPTFSLARGTGNPTDREPELGVDLVVYEGTATMEADTEPILTARLPAGATSWTVPGDRCLPPGRYAWTVRSRESNAETAWSDPALFEVVPAPTRERVAEALDVLERYLQTRDTVRFPAESDGRGQAVNEIARSAAGPEPASIEPKAAPGLGDMTVSGEYRYSAPKLRYLQVPAGSLVPRDPGEAVHMVVDANGIYAYLEDDSGGSASQLKAGMTRELDFPDGASVEEMTCYYWDKGAVDIYQGQMYLVQRPVGNTSLNYSSGFSFFTEDTNQLGIATRTITLNPPFVIDNETKQYTLRVDWEVTADGDDARFYGCRFAYEQPLVSP